MELFLFLLILIMVQVGITITVWSALDGILFLYEKVKNFLLQNPKKKE